MIVDDVPMPTADTVKDFGIIRDAWLSFKNVLTMYANASTSYNSCNQFNGLFQLLPCSVVKYLNTQVFKYYLNTVTGI